MSRIASIALSGALLAASSQIAAQNAQSADAELQALKSLALSTLPNGSSILAVCGPSEGRGYYLWPRDDGWQDDPITAGRLVFVVTPDNEPNILFMDALGEFVNSRTDGGLLSFSFVDPETGSFGVIETYPATGVTSTYVVTIGPDGQLYGLWTALKSHVSVADISKVSAHVTRCVN